MVVCIGAAFLLVAGLLTFGPPIEKYLGRAVGAQSILTYCLVGRAMADPHRRAARRLRDPAVARARRRAPALAVPHGRQRYRRRDLAARLGRVRVLHRPVRLLQQNLGVARCGDHHAHLALVDIACAALRRRVQRRGGAESPTETRRAAETRGSGGAECLKQKRGRPRHMRPSRGLSGASACRHLALGIVIGGGNPRGREVRPCMRGLVGGTTAARTEQVVRSEAIRARRGSPGRCYSRCCVCEHPAATDCRFGER